MDSSYRKCDARRTRCSSVTVLCRKWCVLTQREAPPPWFCTHSQWVEPVMMVPHHPSWLFERGLLHKTEQEVVSSHLLGLLGFLLRVPCIPVVHTSWLLRQRCEQTVHEGGRGRLWGRYSLMVGGQGRWVVVVPNHLTVGWRSSFNSRAPFVLPRQGLLQHADAGMDAWGRSLQSENRQRRNKNDVSKTEEITRCFTPKDLRSIDHQDNHVMKMSRSLISANVAFFTTSETDQRKSCFREMKSSNFFF